jgi:Rrf2 family protein
MNGEFIIAVHVLAYLANHLQRNISSEELSRSACTNPARIRKVMSELRQAGLVETRSGSEGGYLLKVPQEKISLLQVLHAVGAQVVKPGWRIDHPDKNCLISTGMGAVMDNLAADLDAACCQKLQQQTISDISAQLFHRKGESHATF